MAIARKGFAVEPQYMRDPDLMLPRLAEISGDALLAFSPLLAVLLVAAILPPFFLNAWVFSPSIRSLMRMTLPIDLDILSPPSCSMPLWIQ